MPDQIYGVTWNGKEKVSYTYDGLGRLTDKKTGSFSTSYAYPDIGTTRTSTRLRSVTTPAGTYTYYYDNIGNIKTVDDGTYKTSYVYDELNQLVRVNDQKAGKSYTYTYKNGNITSAKEYAYTAGELGEALSTKTWNYTDSVWKDLLTDCNGEAITYDTIGNPLTIGSKELSWNGRQLSQIVNEDNKTVYAYNGDGQRVSKTVNGTKTEYFYNGSILAGEKTGNNTIIFMYDNNGDAFGFTYNKTEYYYIKNAQNDVTAIADSSGKVVASYQYDAWGKLLEVTGTNTDIANINPIRYRSYYYDSDTELYYLSTRYYSPDLCRFINADGYVQTGQDILDKNMFAYCGNNPIMHTDPSGHFWVIAAVAVLAVGLALTLSGCSSKSSSAPLPYATADEAAMAFAVSTYSASRYVRHEYGTMIYSSTSNGVTTYNYTTPVAGTPHSVSCATIKTPSGTKKVATAHTHPNSNSFSGLSSGATSGDIPVAKRIGLDSYVIGPNLNLQKYIVSSNSITVVGIASPTELSSQQKDELISQFQISWDEHLGSCEFGCEDMIWPTIN